MSPGPTGSVASRYGPSSYNTRTSVASSSVNLRGSDRSPPLTGGMGVGAAGAGAGVGVGAGAMGAGTMSDQSFYPGNPNEWTKEDDDFLHNPDATLDKRVSPLYSVTRSPPRIRACNGERIN